MQGSQKSKRVSWPSDANLCQVRLFLSEESPSQVGLGAQDHLQAKKTLSGAHLNGLVSDDNLPPGFEAFNPVNQLKNKLAQIPLVKWRRPPRFILDAAWQVVSGEESKEVELQNQRELRVLEAIYPRESAIPPNPAVSPDAEGTAVPDDHRVPLIPITPIEEEDLSSDSNASINPSISNPSMFSQGAFPPPFQGTSPNFNSPKSAAGGSGGDHQEILKVALTAIAKSNEQIDHDLLLKILSNPSILEQLVTQHGSSPSPSPNPNPNPNPSPSPSPVSQCIPPKPQPAGAPLYMMDPPPHAPPQFNKMETGTSTSLTSAMMSNGPTLYPYPNTSVPMNHQQSVPAPPVKDLSYYKNLIQQHGGERQGEPPISSSSSSSFATHPMHHPSVVNQDALDNSKPRDVKHKIMKPCMYFHTPKGCRHGANCVYQHDTSFQARPSSSIPDMQTAKRMKMDREIRGSQSYT